MGQSGGGGYNSASASSSRIVCTQNEHTITRSKLEECYLVAVVVGPVVCCALPTTTKAIDCRPAPLPSSLNPGTAACQNKQWLSVRVSICIGGARLQFSSAPTGRRS